MTEFVSTEAVNLLSFICQSMPNLRQSILEQSTALPKKEASTLTPTFNSAQIQEAREHPTEYVKQAISAVASIQRAIFTATALLDQHLEQREKLDKALNLTIAHEKLVKQRAAEAAANAEEE